MLIIHRQRIHTAPELWQLDRIPAWKPEILTRWRIETLPAGTGSGITVDPDFPAINGPAEITDGVVLNIMAAKVYGGCLCNSGYAIPPPVVALAVQSHVMERIRKYGQYS